MATEKERKAKLQQFASDMLKVGTVKGFKYFRFDIRGKEELLITVMNQPRSITPMVSPNTSQSELPRNQESLMLSSRTQRRLSGFGYINVGLPPASPSDREIISTESQSTTFLIGAYARYGYPYVWMRTNHERLIRISEDDPMAKDSPLKLKSTSDWASSSVRIWDVIHEIIEICTQPNPSNPFAIDLDFFKSLTTVDRLLSTAAMVYFLQRVLDNGQHAFDAAILADLKQLNHTHFKTVFALSDLS
eukprot:m.257118 g.257118  ORF g.257118 m.257118 type:complete len:247 (-) comp16189_c0_seq4:1760-2500(-)